MYQKYIYLKCLIGFNGIIVYFRAYVFFLHVSHTNRIAWSLWKVTSIITVSEEHNNLGDKYLQNMNIHKQWTTPKI